MKANETKVDKFLATNETTFAIPVYQRNYDLQDLEKKLYPEFLYQKWQKNHICQNENQLVN